MCDSIRIFWCRKIVGYARVAIDGIWWLHWCSVNLAPAIWYYCEKKMNKILLVRNSCLVLLLADSWRLRKPKTFSWCSIPFKRSSHHICLLYKTLNMSILFMSLCIHIDETMSFWVSSYICDSTGQKSDKEIFFVSKSRIWAEAKNPLQFTVLNIRSIRLFWTCGKMIHPSRHSKVDNDDRRNLQKIIDIYSILFLKSHKLELDFFFMTAHSRECPVKFFLSSSQLTSSAINDLYQKLQLQQWRNSAGEYFVYTQ